MKRELILIRHTKSSWVQVDAHDFDRPLKKERTPDAENMAKYLKILGLKPDLILCSPALRTKQTAEFFCDKLKYDYDKIVFDMRLYESSAEDYMQVIRETDKKNKTLVVIGHNPSVTDFANWFLKSRIEEVPTTGVVWFEFDNNDWEIYKTTPCKLTHFLAPKTI
jgi:phosphohistidine phosphatase